MLLGLDLGTGSAKAVLLTPEGQIIGEGSASYAVHSPQPAWAESDPTDWWEAVRAAAGQAASGRGREVQAIGLSGQMHGVVLSQADGTPVRPAVLWADTRSSAQLAHYRALDEEVHLRLGNPYVTGMAGPSLLWLRQHEPDAYSEARWALQPKDWLRLRLTGEVAAEPSDASAILLYDLAADDWAFDVVVALGLRPELLPSLIESGDRAGTLTVEASEHLGLPAGIPVAAGAADTASAMLGTGLLLPGTAQLTVGTAGQIVAPLDAPEIDATFRTHTFRAAARGRWYAMAAMQNVGLALEWVRVVLGAGWDDVYAEAFSVPAGAEGLTFLPYLTGERTPHMDPDARGAWIGLGLHHRRAHLLRAALEGVAFSLRDGLEALVARGIEIPQLRLAGGGSVRQEWRQLLADVLQRPLLAVPDPAVSSRGAALLAGVAAGTYGDAEETLALAPLPLPIAAPEKSVRQYEEAYERFWALYAGVRSVGSR